MLNDILLDVNKPARYIGREWNMPKKDFDKANIKFGLSFPDLYEIGMSNLGIKIIYGILNSLPDVACERIFSCDEDMEKILRQERMAIFSLETGRSLKEFDLVGFSLCSELNYTNALNIMELGFIPQKASLRGPQDPLIIGGGPCALNPEPLWEFFDLFVIGEAEDLILELIDVYRKHKEDYRASRITKQDLLIAFSQIEGVYAPSLYETTYDSRGKIENFRPIAKGIPLKIKKRVVQDLDKAFFPLDWLVPYIQLTHDRITLELMRGCPNKCRFCQARPAYFPLRFRKAENILNLAAEIYKRTGYEELSLCGLSVGEYPRIGELAERLFSLFKTKAVSISLPSLKAEAMMGGLFSLIASVKKTGLTFAPEAGTERLRKILAKDFDELIFFKMLEEAYLSGYQHIKLYFLIGLPTEEEKDLDGIIDLSTRALDLRKRIKKSASAAKPALRGPGRVNISVNTLIPKPHTAMQWLKMQDTESVKHRQNYLKNRVKNNKLVLSFHNSDMGFLEGVLSRGDRRLSHVIYSAFKKGARFDAWGNRFRFDIWLSAFSGSKIDPQFYLQEKSKDELLPWDFIDTGIDKETLRLEAERMAQDAQA